MWIQERIGEHPWLAHLQTQYGLPPAKTASSAETGGTDAASSSAEPEADPVAAEDPDADRHVDRAALTRLAGECQCCHTLCDGYIKEPGFICTEPTGPEIQRAVHRYIKVGSCNLDGG